MNLNELTVALGNVSGTPIAIYIGTDDMVELLNDKVASSYIGNGNFKENKPRTFNGLPIFEVGLKRHLRIISQ